MAKEQKYGISFPIAVSEDEKTLFQLNSTRNEQIKSEIIHLLFTPKGQRLRNPNFGTKLIQYIFSPKDNESVGDILSDIKETINAWLPDCTVESVETYNNDNDDNELYIKIKYSVKEIDGTITRSEIISKI
nr:MAG TPA: baseplate wedge subunit [Caudoviricetes sp.]